MLGVPAGLADDYGGVSVATEARMKQLIHQHFGTGWLGRTMVCIADRESGFNPRAANWTDVRGGSFGLLQINGVHAPGGYATRAWIRRMWDPVANVRRAVRVYRGAGLGAWGGGC